MWVSEEGGEGQSLTTVTSIVSFVPVLMSQSRISSGGVASWTIFTNRVPNSVRKLTQIPSTDVDGWMALFSIRIVMRAHCSSNIAWFGQHSTGAGSLGGATRRDRSKIRQSPRGSHGGYKQLSWSAGTQTSCDAHTFVTFVAKQFFRPHQIFEHFAFPFEQMHELQLCSSSIVSGCLPALIAWYGDNDVLLRHTEDGSDKTEKECSVKVPSNEKWISKLTNFASWSPSTLGTDASKSSDAIDARRTAKTWLWRAFIHVDSTIWTREALCANTSKPTGTRFASASIMTRLILALINWLWISSDSLRTQFACKRFRCQIQVRKYATQTTNSKTHQSNRWSICMWICRLHPSKRHCSGMGSANSRRCLQNHKRVTFRKPRFVENVFQNLLYSQ